MAILSHPRRPGRHEARPRSNVSRAGAGVTGLAATLVEPRLNRPHLHLPELSLIDRGDVPESWTVDEQPTLRRNMLDSLGAQNLPGRQFSPRMLALFRTLDGRLPVTGVRAAWPYDPSNPSPRSRPDLQIEVTLSDPRALPNSSRVAYLSSQVPPGYDLTRLAPEQLIPTVYVAENLGGFQAAANAYLLTSPRPK